MQIIDGVHVWGDPLENAVQQMRECDGPDVAHRSMMGDHHLGYGVPIGGVVAYRDKINPEGVGFDIACGNKAVLTDANAADVRAHISEIMDRVWADISFGVGRKNKFQGDWGHPVLSDDPAWSLDYVKALNQKAADQLGTVGSGNHYVDIFVDELERVWIGVHFGSRGLGWTLANRFMKSGLLDVSSQEGREYLACMHLAGRYAYAGRDWVCDRVLGILAAASVEEIHNHHNFAWKENHFGEDLWVVRKGATPAFPGQRSFVGGTMAEYSVILEGVDSPKSAQALYSTVHGAGRAMSRSEAAGSRWKKSKPGARRAEGKVSDEMMAWAVMNANVELRGAGVDESPHCYKRLYSVLDAHAGTVKILHKLHPIGVAMAGPDCKDPYKD